MRPFAAPCTFDQVKLAMITDTSYQPTTLVAPTSVAPITQNSTPINTASPEYNDLQTAFGRAPASFKNQLCGLEGVFFMPAGATYPGGSWGLRTPSDLSKRYIGISHNLWQLNAAGQFQAINLNDYQTMVVNALLPGLGNPLKFDAASPSNDGPTMLLAVLAHEFGHVWWTDLFIKNPGDNPDFSKFCPGIFPTASWSNAPAWTSWRHFRDITDTTADASDPDDPPPSSATDDPSYKEIKVPALVNLVNTGKMRKAYKVII
jgi:hypothetical protein